MIAFRLAVRSLLRDRARALCALCGIAAATGLLVWNLGLAQTASGQAPAAVRKATAPYAAWVTGKPNLRESVPNRFKGPEGQSGESVPNSRESVPSGRGDAPAYPGVMGGRRGGPPQISPLEPGAMDAMPEGTVFLNALTVQLDARTKDGTALQGPPLRGVAAAAPSASFVPPGNKSCPEMASIFAFDPAPASDEIPSALFADTLFGRRVPQPEIGSTIDLILPRGTLSLRVAGFFAGPGRIQGLPSIYAPEQAIARMHMLSMRLLPPQNRGALLFSRRAAPSLALIPEGAAIPEPGDSFTVTTRADVEESFRSDTAANLRRSLPLSISLAVVTAIAMLATVLLSGIAAERRRIAILRCAGMTRSGVVGMICAETLVLALAGWGAGIVFGLGALQVFLLCEASPEIPAMVNPGAITFLASLALAVFSALAAMLVPAVKATRVRPLEAIGQPSEKPARVRPRRVVLGLALLAPIAVAAFAEGVDTNIRTILMIAVGLPCYVAGSLLLIHPVMRLVEIVFLHPLGALLRLDPRLLSRRLSRAPGRAMGAVLTISLGLGAFMAIRIWGGTLMSSYVPSPEWPDAIVSLLPEGISGEACSDVAGALVSGVNPPCSRVIPIEATQIPLAGAEPSGQGAAGESQGQLLLFGTDPEATFGGGAPFFAPRFVEGSRDEALAALKDGDACVIPAMLSRITGLHCGDTLALADGSSLRIAGVIDFNWHMVTSRSQVRTRFAVPGSGPARTMGMAFCPEAFARRLAREPDTVRFLWCRFSPGYLRLHPLDAAVRLEESIRARLDETGAGASAAGGVAVQAHHRDEIADGTLAHGSDILGTMARIPLWSLVVTCTGIAAMLVASARAGRRETDVMRAVGLTRGQLARLFLGEAALTVLCTLVISIAGGMLLGWSFAEVTRINMRSGLPIRFIVPWGQIAKGTVLTVALSFVFALVPLRRITR